MERRRRDLFVERSYKPICLSSVGAAWIKLWGKIRFLTGRCYAALLHVFLVFFYKQAAATRLDSVQFRLISAMKRRRRDLFVVMENLFYVTHHNQMQSACYRQKEQNGHLPVYLWNPIFPILIIW